MTNQELNKKLAEWAGFEEGTHIIDSWYDGRLRWRSGDKFWKRPDGIGQLAAPPNFTSSLDACFKWLVPKLNKQGLRIRLINQPQGRDTFFCAIGGRWLAHEWAEEESLALTLCKAIEKLIDGEKSG